MRYLHLLLLFTFPAITYHSYAQETYYCPERIVLQSAQLKEHNLPDGYQLYVSDGPIWLSGASVYDGKPEGDGLKPTKAKSDIADTLVWKFEDSHKNTSISCDYAYGVFRVFHSLPKPVQECKAYVTHVGDPKIRRIKFVCQ